MMQPKRCGQENQPLKDIKASRHEGNQFEIHDKQKWIGQDVGVNSNVPLVDSGTGKQYVIRQFEFHFNPEVIKRGMPVDKQAIFNSHWRQIQLELWKDGLKAYEGVDPRIVIGKSKYKIILVCEPKLGVMIADKAQTLQQITPSRKSA